MRGVLSLIDREAGLERALAALWPDVPAQRCTVHKHGNLLAHAPDALHEEVSANYTDVIYADTAKGVQARGKAFLRKWRLKCPGVATSLEKAGDRLFAFLRLPPSQGKSARTLGKCSPLLLTSLHSPANYCPLEIRRSSILPQLAPAPRCAADSRSLSVSVNTGGIVPGTTSARISVFT